MSESEEMYLVTIARLVEKGEEGPVPVSQLAAELSVMPVSANQMIRKLEESGWVCYTPYKGVSLTSEGQAIALQILRHRRLWEVFLVENLKIPVTEAADLACRMEHFLPTDAADRLAAFLGNPALTPTGSAIPAANHSVHNLMDVPITAVGLDQNVRVARIETDSAGRTFLASAGVLPGEEVRVLATSGSGAILLQTADGCCTHLSSTLAQALWVQRVDLSSNHKGTA